VLRAAAAAAAQLPHSCKWHALLVMASRCGYPIVILHVHNIYWCMAQLAAVVLGACAAMCMLYNAVTLIVAREQPAAGPAETSAALKQAASE
jgi:hypothetical protein